MFHCKIFKVPTVTQERALLLRGGGNRTRALRCGEVGGVWDSASGNGFPGVCRFPGGAFPEALGGRKLRNPGEGDSLVWSTRASRYTGLSMALSQVSQGAWESHLSPMGEGVLCSSLFPEGGRAGLSSPQRFTRSSGSCEVHSLRWEAEKGLCTGSSAARLRCSQSPSVSGSRSSGARHQLSMNHTRKSQRWARACTREIPTSAYFSKYLLTQSFFLAAKTTKTAFLNEQKVDQCLK